MELFLIELDFNFRDIYNRHTLKKIKSKYFDLNNRHKILRGFKNLAGLDTDNQRFTNKIKNVDYLNGTT
jgi:hypothetical protein